MRAFNVKLPMSPRVVLSDRLGQRGRLSLQRCVRLPFHNDIDHQQPERLTADIGSHVPLPHRFQDEISWFVSVASSGFYIGHAQFPDMT
jgi:hypothetical protein